MSNERSSSKSGLFLIELIISIVLFAIASAICTQLFVQAHLTSTLSKDISIASTIAQNRAEEMKSMDGNQWAEQMVKSSQPFIYYDQQGLPLTGSGEATYLLNLRYSGGSPLNSAEITVYKVEALGANWNGEDMSSQEPLIILQVNDYNRVEL